ncbi:MAG: type III pantothenate kinase [Desulfobulbaceae bacterium]|jgi:type III pantothenate kinase|nr:type III pantothenate kinase [Desulfobulbaceae bacterium]
MLFVVDIGNTNTVTGLYDGDKLIATWRMQSDRASTADELAIRYRALLSMHGVLIKDIRAVVIASVVPVLETAWLDCCERYFNDQGKTRIMAVSGHKLTHLITVAMPNPDEVGADRLVNAIAAYERFQRGLIIVDFGTAITFDCVTARREYIGGVIAPGIGISLEALATRTAKLPMIDISNPPKKVIGNSTVCAMKSGILHGYGGLIDGLTQDISQEMRDQHNSPPVVVATGGMARVIAPYTSSLTHIDPMLTLTGLKIIHERTAA